MTKKLVILGGGAAGFLIAAKIKHSKLDLDVTLIDIKSFFEYTPALCSVLYEKTLDDFTSHFKNITFDYKKVLGKMNVKFIQGAVKEVKDSQVLVSVLDEILSVDYDYMAVCTGSSYADIWKTNENSLELESRLDYLKEQRQAYLNASSILCIGGGPVGVEVAGEIICRSSKKKITLVNSKPTVLFGAPNNIGEKAQGVLDSRGIQLIMNEKAEKKGDVYITNITKQVFRPDLVYNCVGVKPNSHFLSPDWLDDRGYVKVENTLNVQGKNNVFALGDINNIGEAKMYYSAHMQAMHFVRNLFKILNGKEMIPYKHAEPAMFISLGPDHGVGTLSRLCFSGWPFCEKKGSRTAAWIKYIIEKISVQEGSNIEILTNEILYGYNRLF